MFIFIIFKLTAYLMPNVVLTHNLGYAGKGTSQAQIMTTENGDFYFVKFKENAQGTIKVLVNEFVAGRIAEHLELPCAPCFIAELDPLLAPTITINGNSVSTGSHFASKKIDNIYNGSPPIRGLISTCGNKDKFSDIISFDVLTFNFDRNNDGNFLIVSTAKGYDLFIIDHGHCFGFNWTTTILLSLIGNLHLNAFIPEMRDEITASSNFDEAIAKVESITDPFIASLVNEVPTDWLSDKNEIDALQDYIIKQRSSLKTIIHNNKTSLFPKWI